MEKKFIENFIVEQEIEEVFYVEEKFQKVARNGKVYLDLLLRDRTGKIRAKKWDWDEEKEENFEQKQFVVIKALVESYKDNLQLNVISIRKIDQSLVDVENFIASLSREQVETYFKTVLKILDEVENPYVRQLLDSFFRDPDFVEKFLKCPAAREIHHEMLGGLVKHVSYMLAIARFLAKKIYKDLDYDLLIAGIALHDIGKVEELSANMVIDYTLKGELIGHAVLGVNMVRDRIKQIPDFPEDLALLIEHMLLSHHGQADYGAVRVPRFKEAMLLHLIDSIDAKMEIMSKSLKAVPENEIWSQRCWPIENRKLLKIDSLSIGKQKERDVD